MTSPDFIANLTSMLQQQSTLLAFVYTFGFIMVSYFVLIPLLALFKRVKKGEPPAAGKA